MPKLVSLYSDKQAFVAHNGCLDILLYGFRKLLGELNFDAIKIVRLLRLNYSITIDQEEEAPDSPEIHYSVDPLVADAAGELRATHVTVRTKLKRLQDLGYIEFVQDTEKASRKRVILTEQALQKMREMEHQTACLLDVLMEVRNAYAEPGFDASSITDDAWAVCDPLHPRHKHMIPRANFRK